MGNGLHCFLEHIRYCSKFLIPNQAPKIMSLVYPQNIHQFSQSSIQLSNKQWEYSCLTTSSIKDVELPWWLQIDHQVDFSLGLLHHFSAPLWFHCHPLLQSTDSKDSNIKHKPKRDLSQGDAWGTTDNISNDHRLSLHLIKDVQLYIQLQI